MSLRWHGLVLWFVASTVGAQDTLTFPTLGEIVRHDARFDALVPAGATIDVIGSGFAWSEGPVWVHRDGGFLLFSDIPHNRIMRWRAGDGVSLFLQPAGYTGVADYGGERGTNGLAIDAAGNLVCCEHGDRRVSRMTWDGGKRTVADNFQGQRFNSPNDLVYHSSGDLYCTDPPYGLPERWDDPRRELDFCGVYRLTPAGELTLLTREMTRPNGIGFSPDEKTLYVAQSDSEAAIWRAFAVEADGTLGASRVFYDATDMVQHHKGLPDGMAIDGAGNLFATGPGGVLVFAPDGTLLGRIDTKEATANCCFGGPNGSTLFITADMWLCKVETRTAGLNRR